jgi:hypothetical protein
MAVSKSFIKALVLFQHVFNHLFGESLDCGLVSEPSLSSKQMNWHKLNMQICFTYFHQEFYLLPDSIKELAQGENQDKIVRLLTTLIDFAKERRGASNYHLLAKW